MVRQLQLRARDPGCGISHPRRSIEVSTIPRVARSSPSPARFRQHCGFPTPVAQHSSCCPIHQSRMIAIVPSTARPPHVSPITCRAVRWPRSLAACVSAGAVIFAERAIRSIRILYPPRTSDRSGKPRGRGSAPRSDAQIHDNSSSLLFHPAPGRATCWCVQRVNERSIFLVIACEFNTSHLPAKNR